MVQIPLSLFYLCLSIAGIIFFYWTVDLIQDAWKKYQAQLELEQEARDRARFGEMEIELEGHRARIAELEADKKYLLDEVSTLVKRNIQISNELRCDDGHETQYLTPVSSARFSKIPQ